MDNRKYLFVIGILVVGLFLLEQLLGYLNITESYLFLVFWIIVFSTKNFYNYKILLLTIIYFDILFSGDRTPFIMINLYLFLMFIFNINKLIYSKHFKLIVVIVPIILLLLTNLHLSNKLNLVSFQKYKNTYLNIKNDLNNRNEGGLGLKRWAYYGIYLKSYVIFKINK